VSHAAGSEERNIRVLTVDDQAVFRGVARDVIEASPGFESAGQAGSGEHALRLVEELAPDLVLLDVRMPGMSGIEVAARLLEEHPEMLVVLISIEEPLDLRAAAQLGEQVPLLRKQDFGPRALKKVWAEHGPTALARRPT
jgi:DNA-binding NarL/FixJ family response regulator